MSRSARVWLALCFGAVGFLSSGCRHFEPLDPSAQAEPLEASQLAALRPPGAPWGLQFSLRDEDEARERFEFRFWRWDGGLGDFAAVRGDFYRARSARPTPLIVLAPILAGPVDDYRASRFLAESAAESGVGSFFVHQEELILAPERDAAALEARLRRSVRENIAALDLFAALPEVDEGRLGSIGVSLGSIRNLVLAAAEPRLSANVFCLAGSGLETILVHSREPLVEAYLEARRAGEALSPDEVASEIVRDLPSRPRELLASIGERGTLLILARFDNKVPYQNGLELARSLPRASRVEVSTGHYTAFLLAPWIANRAISSLLEAWSGEMPASS